MKGLWERLKESGRLRELAMYTVVGVLTTLVNIGAFWVLRVPVRAALGIAQDAPGYLTGANVAANVLSIVFAFFANKLYVFESRSWEPSVALREALEFGAARLLSLLLDVSLVDFLVLRAGAPEMPAKVAVNVLVIAVNYVLSKVWIFRKKR